MAIERRERHVEFRSGPGRTRRCLVRRRGYGAYGLGVMEALFSGQWQYGRQGAVEPSIFTGTSVGSFNAAYMVAESGLRTEAGCLAAVRGLRKLWLDRIAATSASENGVFRLRGDPRTVLRNPVTALLQFGDDVGHLVNQTVYRGPKFVLTGGPVLQRLVEQVDLSSFVSTEPFNQLVSEVISSSRILAQGARTLKIATTNWDTGEVVVFRNNAADDQRHGRDVSTKASYARRMLTVDNTVQAVLASAAVPGLFPPIRMDDDNYVDGGLLMNTPLHPAISSNAQTLHVVYLDPDFERIPRGEVQSTAFTLNRMTDVAFANIKQDVEYAKLMRRLMTTANRIPAENASDPVIRKFLDDFAGMTELTVHRYFPSRSLGGIYGMLDFDSQRLIDMMELGFDDTVRHDCRANGCLVDA